MWIDKVRGLPLVIVGGIADTSNYQVVSKAVHYQR